MATPMENITRTLILPPGSEERFISFPQHADGDGWFGQGVALAGLSRLAPGYQVRHQRAKYHLFAYAVGGQALYQGEGGEERVLDAGALLFMPAGRFQCLRSSGEFAMAWLLLRSDHRRWLALQTRREVVCRPWPGGGRFAALMEMLHAESQLATVAGQQVAACYCHLIFACLERELSDWGQSAAASRRLERLEQLWAEVRSRLEQPWPVARLAKIAGMSVSHLHAAVAASCSAGPQEMVRRLRLDRAKGLLRHSDHKLERIAELTGFGSAFALSRSFKQHTGLSPRQFRNQDN